jgi:hypothetical protein
MSAQVSPAPLSRKMDYYFNREDKAIACASLRLRLLLRKPKSPFFAQFLAFLLSKNGLNAHA